MRRLFRVCTKVKGYITILMEYYVGTLLRKLVNRIVRQRIDETDPNFSLLMEHYFQFFVKVLSSCIDYSIPFQDQVILVNAIRQDCMFLFCPVGVYSCFYAFFFFFL